MPEAIATTKRKFYKALDALSASPISDPTQSPLSSTTKRSSSVAFEEARERVGKRLRQSTSSASLAHAASVIRVPAKSKDGGSESRAPPNYSPWSQEAFLARLKTFGNVSQWHPKPDCINEVQWAKQGWVCVDLNTVACKNGCGKRVVVSLDTSHDQSHGDKDEEELQEEDDDAKILESALAQRFESAMVDGHTETCLWRNGGCKDDILRLPVVRPSVWQPELKLRFAALQAIYRSIQLVHTKPLEASTAKLVDGLPSEIFGMEEPPSEHFSKACEIAMHGWRGSTDAGNDLLQCDACFQRIGLWMYQPGYRSSRPSAGQNGDAEDDTPEGSPTLDLLEMHRDYCPWWNPDTQKATGGLSGLNACQILYRVVENAVRDHRRRSGYQSIHKDKQVDEDRTQDNALPTPAPTREEIIKQDKERLSRLQRLKRLFNLKRRTPQARAI